MIKPLPFVNLCLCLSSFKLLFLRSYVSTDFDVHRNWMAITYNLPLKDWYYDTTSQWTLDYPPLFAAFEFFLALVAHLLGLEDNLNLTESIIRTQSIVIYQKATVILADFLYYFAVYQLCKSLEPLVPKVTFGKKKNNNGPVEAKPVVVSQEQNLLDAIYRPDSTSCVALLLLLQPGLLLVDHIHFQYNGLLSGIFLLSMANIISGNYASASFWFALLLNFKHIYLYCAPAFGMYILTSHCLARVPKQNRLKSFIVRAARLALVVIVVFIITYGPFADLSTLKQIAARLFPFKRGLTHAYWAPNTWALYNVADKILATIFKNSLKVKFDLDSISRTRPISSTSGLVQEYEHQYLPSISPLTTFILVATFTVPLVIKMLTSTTNRRSPVLFMKSVTLAAFTSFMFGWHVHEKAIIVVLLPMVPVSFIDPKLTNLFLRLTLAGTYSLFPLLFQPAEYLTKLTILLTYYCYARSLNPTRCQPASPEQQRHNKGFIGSLCYKLYNFIDKSYVLAVILTEFYVILVHGHFNYGWNPLAKLNRYEFLPLMLTSSISALGITFSYLELYYDFVLCIDEAAAAA